MAVNEDQGKIIHSANSQLAVIWGYVQILEKNLEGNTKESEWIKKISDECKKLMETLDSLRSAK